MPTAHDLQLALERTRDRRDFLRTLLIEGLEWPVPDHVEDPEEIAYAWSAADLRTDGLDKKLVDGQVWQIQALQGDQPWGIFLLEFAHADAFTSSRGLTGPLRKVLRGLVPSRRQHSHLATWKRENLLFICTHGYEHFRFAYFKAPLDKTHAAPLAAFGWGPDMPARTACEFNLPALVWPGAGTSEADWVSRWASAFDVEKVTKKFYDEYARVFAALEKTIADENGLNDGDDLRMFTQTLVNRLMFLRFLERKGWLKFNGREDYLRTLYDAGPFGQFVQDLLVCPPTDDQNEQAVQVVSRLIDIAAERQRGRNQVLDRLSTEFGIAKPSQKLLEPATLDVDGLTAEIQKSSGKRQPLSAAQVAAVKNEYARSINPLQALAAEARQLERRVSDLVNAAFGLTEEEVRLMWQTAPPRMPGEPPWPGRGVQSRGAAH